MAPTRSFKSKQKQTPETEEEKIEDGDGKPGCIYIGHIPHGFYEDEMKSYFSQFGNIMGVKICRSKKNGNSKGYGFVKFRYAAVAKTVAETCHNYLFFNKLLKCHFKPLSEVHKDTFKPWTFKPKTAPKRRFNNPKSEEKLKQSTKKSVSKAQRKLEKLKRASGLDVNLDDILDVPEVAKQQAKPGEKRTKESQETIEKTETEPIPEPPKKRKRVSQSIALSSPASENQPRVLRSQKVATPKPVLKASPKEKKTGKSPKVTKPKTPPGRKLVK